MIMFKFLLVIVASVVSQEMNLNVINRDVALANQESLTCKTSNMLLTILNNLLDTLTNHLKTNESPTIAKINTVIDLVNDYLKETVNSFHDEELYYKFKGVADELEESKGPNEFKLLARSVRNDHGTPDRVTTVAYQYDLPGANEPNCREAYLKLILIAHNAYMQLANHPKCKGYSTEIQMPLRLPNDHGIFPNSLIQTPHTLNQNVLQYKDLHAKPKTNSLLQANVQNVNPSYDPYLINQNSIQSPNLPQNSQFHKLPLHGLNDDPKPLNENLTRNPLFIDLPTNNTIPADIDANIGHTENVVDEMNKRGNGHETSTNLGNNSHSLDVESNMPKKHQDSKINNSRQYQNSVILNNGNHGKIVSGRYPNDVDRLKLPTNNDVQPILNKKPVANVRNQEYSNDLVSNKEPTNHNKVMGMHYQKIAQNGNLTNQSPNIQDGLKGLGAVSQNTGRLPLNYNVLNNANPLQKEVSSNRPGVISSDINPIGQNQQPNNSPNLGDMVDNQFLLPNEKLFNGTKILVVSRPNNQQEGVQNFGGIPNNQNRIGVQNGQAGRKPQVIIKQWSMIPNGHKQQNYGFGKVKKLNDQGQVGVFYPNTIEYRNRPKSQFKGRSNSRNPYNIELQNGQIKPQINLDLQNVRFENSPYRPFDHRLVNHKQNNMYGQNNIQYQPLGDMSNNKKGSNIPKSGFPFPKQNLEFINPNTINSESNYGKHDNYEGANKYNSLWAGVSNDYKLKPSADNASVIELTYLLKRPDPIFQLYYVVKYRLPYFTFLTQLKDLLLRKPYLRSNPVKLYQELTPESITEVSADLKNQAKYTFKNLVSQAVYVKAELLNNNNTVLNKQLNVQELNSNLEFEDVIKAIDSLIMVNNSADIGTLDFKNKEVSNAVYTKELHGNNDVNDNHSVNSPEANTENNLNAIKAEKAPPNLLKYIRFNQHNPYALINSQTNRMPLKWYPIPYGHSTRTIMKHHEPFGFRNNVIYG